MLHIENNTINLDLFQNIILEIKENEEYAYDIIDSLSANQFKSKIKLLELIGKLPLDHKDLEIIIFGCWYGSILIPGLYRQAQRITGIDLDEKVLKIAKNRFFKNKQKLEFIAGDVFDKDLSRYHSCDLFINTSCEHMKPMKEWPFWSYAKTPSYFAFQSNNMFDIEGHVNCVHNISDFKSQLPINFTTFHEYEVEDSRGIRFTIVGKIEN
jgi:SAM-dependent methyltransferase